MTPVEIYTEESTNREVMILRPEGKFYRLYERSPFLFCKTVRVFKPTKRFYKNIGQEVVSIGTAEGLGPVPLRIILFQKKIHLDPSAAVPLRVVYGQLLMC